MVRYKKAKNTLRYLRWSCSRIFSNVVQCIPVSRKVCRLLPPSRSTLWRMSNHCSMLQYTPFPFC